MQQIVDMCDRTLVDLTAWVVKNQRRNFAQRSFYEDDPPDDEIERPRLLRYACSRSPSGSDLFSGCHRDGLRCFAPVCFFIC